MPSDRAAPDHWREPRRARRAGAGELPDESGVHGHEPAEPRDAGGVRVHARAGGGAVLQAVLNKRSELISITCSTGARWLLSYRWYHHAIISPKS
eukprot:1183036-Prorocentrum_minimum.AAC.1